VYFVDGIMKYNLEEYKYFDENCQEKEKEKREGREEEHRKNVK